MSKDHGVYIKAQQINYDELMYINDLIGHDSDMIKAMAASVNPDVKVYGTNEQLEQFLDYVEFNIEILQDIVQTSSYENLDLN